MPAGSVWCMRREVLRRRLRRKKNLLGAERLAQGIRLACFLKAVPDGKMRCAAAGSRRGGDHLCKHAVCTVSCLRRRHVACSAVRARQCSAAVRAHQRCAVCRSCAQRAALPSSRRGGGYRYNDNCSRPLSGRPGCRNDGCMESAVRVRRGCHQPDGSFSGGKSR